MGIYIFYYIWDSGLYDDNFDVLSVRWQLVYMNLDEVEVLFITTRNRSESVSVELVSEVHSLLGAEACVVALVGPEGKVVDSCPCEAADLQELII